jgi:hypothetical protein
MGSFRQHLTGGIAGGIACGVVSHQVYNLQIEDAVAGGLLCMFGSLLPDIDCPVSRPADFVIRISSVLVPVFAIQSLPNSFLTPSRILIIAVLTYLFAVYGIRELIKRFTEHRGIIHSIPAALIWGGLVFMAFRNSAHLFQIVVAVAATAGFAIHLIIDELYSLVDISGGKFTPKKSAGTALKLFSNSFFVNLLTYSLLGLILYFCIRQGGFI